jgi:HEAT repeat protein
MRRNEKNIETYATVIWALGQIGDPRAIPHLAKGWWSQKEKASAYAAARFKIDALGNIKDKRCIDAILDLFYAVPDGDLAPVGKNILNSLIKLTGQNLGISKRAWKDWWKKNRATFKFK